MKDPYLLQSYHFDLPDDLIAQHPAQKRDESRLMIVDRKTGSITERPFFEIVDLLPKKSRIIANNTKVLKARLHGTRQTGGKVEILLLEKMENHVWKCMTKAGGSLRPRNQIYFELGLVGEVIEDLNNGVMLISFNKEDILSIIEVIGHMPLPPYIRKGKDNLEDRDRYQTVYANELGSIAAPTAGLHFTKELLAKLSEKEINWLSITLHVGIGTFLPIRCEDIREHKMHTEKYFIDADAANILSKKNEQIMQLVVGTTTARALESSSTEDRTIHSGYNETNLFITPDYRFRFVQTLLTNFHLPCSSLLILVASFMGYELMREAYAKAVKDRFRFFSYGDAMLIL